MEDSDTEDLELPTLSFPETPNMEGPNMEDPDTEKLELPTLPFPVPGLDTTNKHKGLWRSKKKQ